MDLNGGVSYVFLPSVCVSNGIVWLRAPLWVFVCVWLCAPVYVCVGSEH